MVESVNIYSQNCRGLNAFQKRRDLFHLLHRKKYNIVCLQDVHLESKMESYVKHEWGHMLYLSGKNSNSRGVMVLFNNNFEYEVGRVIRDTDGNYIILEVTIQGKKIILVNIYGPNDDKPQFYKEIKQKILTLENEQVIWCGDWNLVLDQDMDTENYVHINNPRARAVVLDFLLENNYVDAWRVLHEGKRSYTWRKFNPERKQSRLDYFLISEELFQYVIDCSILSGYRTDHSGVLLKLKLQENERGRGYWKFNNSLLKDTGYIEIVKETIIDVKNTYRTPLNNNDNHIVADANDHRNNNDRVNTTTDNNSYNTINNNNNNNDNNNNDNNNNYNNNNEEEEEDNFSINDQLLLETILFTIRGETIKYSSRKKKLNMEKEIQSEREIKGLVMSMMVSFVLSFFPRDVLDEILNLIESVSEDFPSYS